MKKFIYVGLIACLGLSSSFAQDKTTKPFIAETKIENKYEVRDRLIDTYGVKGAEHIGWYIGNLDEYEIRLIESRYLTLSNELSNVLNKLVVIEANKSDLDVGYEAKNNNVDIVYTSSIVGAELVKFGWTPILGRTNTLKPVILTLNESPINKVADLKGKKILGVKNSTTYSFTKYGLIKESIITLDDKNLTELQVNQNDLIKLLNEKKYDGIIVRDIVATKLIKENPEKYKIVYNSPLAPSHMIFVNKNVSAEKKAKLNNFFLNLSPKSEYEKDILKALDGYTNELTPFATVNEESLETPKEVLTTLKSSRLK